MVSGISGGRIFFSSQHSAKSVDGRLQLHMMMITVYTLSVIASLLLSTLVQRNYLCKTVYELVPFSHLRLPKKFMNLSHLVT